MKSLIWGVVLLSIVTAILPWQMNACDERKSLMTAYVEASSMVAHVGENTVVISSDDDFVTVAVYENADSNWM